MEFDLAKKVFHPIETALGVLRGRDAIHLDTFEFELHGVLRLGGEINGKLASRPTDNFFNYSLVFSNVLAFKVIEFDSWDHQSESSFDEIADSEWCKTLGGKITPDHRHYQVQTYDDVIEVVATKFSLSIEDTTTR